jgi:hypothetical protein
VSNYDQRDQRIYQEALALWQALYDEPPPAVASGSDLLAAVLTAMSERGYSHLTSTSRHHRDIVLPCPELPRS